MRFPLEVVAAVRRAVGVQMPLLYRMSADDRVPGGITPAQSGPLAAELERAGVDLIDVSAGTYESILATQPPMEAPPGQLLSLAATIKRYVSIPVATAGKLVDLAAAEHALAAGQVDFVTIGRGLHADPELLSKARTGRLDEVRRCIACAECVAFLGQDEPAYCAINPTTIRERALRPRRAAISKDVLIVGGGPAGLEAARGAAVRGHHVTLLERSQRLGGQVTLGALSPGRQDFAEPVRFLERELRRLGVRTNLRGRCRARDRQADQARRGDSRNRGGDRQPRRTGPGASPRDRVLGLLGRRSGKPSRTGAFQRTRGVPRRRVGRGHRR